ncbi:Transmembrane protein 53 [Madurella mycetomatis]|uniref:Transmembrane protein 53 n=1 Tax=Madurella mycetomatis TaxID=100816 RepID=A0A175WEP0_9PEZI|nr:Transmembrane protein 53 [Madurella mycetomatis]
MASNAPVAAAAPLSFMTKLSPSVYLYRPTAASTSPSPKPAPKLILLASWMGARDPHIAKYILQYQALYPSSPILLVRSEPRHFMRPRSVPAEHAPAVSILRAAFPDNNPSSSPSPSSNPQLLIHAFSNGGCTTLQQLRGALGRSNPLPPYAIVLDSCPGQFAYRSSYLAFTVGLAGVARLLLAPLVHALCAWYWLRHELLGRGMTGPIARMARALNERSSLGGEVRRTYVYSEGDRLVEWRGVEKHAEEARAKGFAVRTEKFEGSEHVAHARKHGERYWRVVRETWEGLEK